MVVVVARVLGVEVVLVELLGVVPMLMEVVRVMAQGHLVVLELLAGQLAACVLGGEGLHGGGACSGLLLVPRLLVLLELVLLSGCELSLLVPGLWSCCSSAPRSGCIRWMVPVLGAPLLQPLL